MEKYNLEIEFKEKKHCIHCPIVSRIDDSCNALEKKDYDSWEAQMEDCPLKNQSINKDIKKAFDEIKTDSKFDKYKELAKLIGDAGKVSTEVYDLLKNKVGSEITEAQAFALFIIDTRNALTCLKRLERILTKNIEQEG